MHVPSSKKFAPAPAPSSTSAWLSPEQTGTVAKLGESSVRNNCVKSNNRNILPASPVFPGFCADADTSSAPNSCKAKILAQNYKKILMNQQWRDHQYASLQELPSHQDQGPSDRQRLRWETAAPAAQAGRRTGQQTAHRRVSGQTQAAAMLFN